MTQLRVAFITPPLIGHKNRGIGVYTEQLFQSLKQSNQVTIESIGFEENADRFDIIHYPFFDPFFLTLPLFTKKPTIVTVHDLIPLKFPSQFPTGIRGKIKWQIQRFSLILKQALITDSYASKRDIVEFTGINEGKVSVIYLGVGKEFQTVSSRESLSEIKKKLNLPDKFILHVGDVNYNKNIVGLVSAFEQVRKKHPDLNLVLVGMGFERESIPLNQMNGFVRSLGLTESVFRFGRVSQKELTALYNLAACYVQPSFAEGFGLPVLEAMACGCPVVSSNTKSLAEVVGDAGLLINPFKPTEIAEAINRILTHNTLRLSYRKKGAERVKQFSWEKTATETIHAYRMIMRSK